MRPRWLYFTMFVIFSSVGRFMGVFLSDRGLTNAEIGWVLGTRSVVIIFCGPLFSGLADYLQSEKKVLSCLVPLSAAFYSLFWVVITPQGPFTSHGSRLGVCWGIYTLTAVFLTPVSPIVDGLTLKWLSSVGSSSASGDMYGRERVWGAISWAIANLTLGIIMDYTGTWMMLVMMAIGAISLTTVVSQGEWNIPLEKKNSEIDLDIPEIGELEETEELNLELEGKDIQLQTTSYREVPSEGIEAIHSEVDVTTREGFETETKESEEKQGISCLMRVRRVLKMACKNPEVVAFLVCVATMGMAMSLVEMFLFIFLTQSLGSSLLICGVSVVVTVMFEIPLFMISDSLFERFGVVPLIVIAQVAYAIRALGYTLFDNPWLVLAVEPLHGVTYACFKTALVQYTKSDVADQGLETTAQGMASAVNAIGQICGQWIGGWVLQEYGSNILYRGAALIVCISSSLLVGVHLFHRTRNTVSQTRFERVPSAVSELGRELVGSHSDL
ncbi:hypothetical protein AAMO2058_000182600 [Amorphochlora amoebiformis]